MIEGELELRGVHTSVAVDAEVNYSGNQSEALRRQRSCRQGVAVMIRRQALQDMLQGLTYLLS